MELFRSENIIHPTAILEGNIRMGKRNEIGPYVILRGDIELGDFNKISGGVSVANTVTWRATTWRATAWCAPATGVRRALRRGLAGRRSPDSLSSTP
jgi:UDP-3-O-[3-hydroxymyristoyl] glucosamine N-acyltransferase